MDKEDKVYSIICKHIKKVPFEGDDVDSTGIREDVDEFYMGLMRGLVTEVATNYKLDTKGYLNIETGKYSSRDGVIDIYLKKLTFK